MAEINETNGEPSNNDVARNSAPSTAANSGGVPKLVTSKCIMCNSPSTNHCIQCKSASYCSTKCQKNDWSLHKVLCKEYANFAKENPRPTPEHKLGLFFPYNSETPRLLWVPLQNPTVRLRGPDVEEFLKYPGEEKLGSREVTSIFERCGNATWPLDHGLMMYCRANFVGDSLNRCIHKLGQGYLQQQWGGPIIVTSHRNGIADMELTHMDITTAGLDMELIHMDITMADLRFVVQHLQVPPGLRILYPTY